jgi:hypothetical protein
MHEATPKPTDVSPLALLALFGKEGIIDMIGEEGVLDMIGEEKARRWLARRGQATSPEAGNSLTPDDPVVKQCGEPAPNRSKPSP